MKKKVKKSSTKNSIKSTKKRERHNTHNQVSDTKNIHSKCSNKPLLLIGLLIGFLVFISFLGIVFIYGYLNINDEVVVEKIDDSNEDTLFFLKSKMCTVNCDEMLPIAKDFANKSGLSFRIINYPIDEIDIPGYFVLLDDKMSVLSGIQEEFLFASELCKFTNSEEICSEAEKLKSEGSFESQEQDVISDESASEVNLEGLYEFNQCLAENGIVIYGSSTCPYCGQLVELLGGSDAVKPVYVECTQNQQKCMDEMLGRGVPEIQLDGELYEGQRTIDDLAKATNCQIPV
ncbi:MAG: glutaredoxin domain-containing protein [Nanoarchaeota archaeon]